MTKFRDKFMYRMDKLGRGIPNKFGLRQFDIFLQVKSWSGQTAGEGTQTVLTVPVWVNTTKPNSGNNRPNVRQLSQQDVVASGGELSDIDFKIGPLTPSFVNPRDGYTYGTLPSDIEKMVQSNPQEIYVIIKGPGMSDSVNGDKFKIISSDFTHNFEYFFTARKIGVS